MGSGKLQQMQDRILEKRMEKIKKLYPDMAIAQVTPSNLPLLPRKMGGEGKRFTIRGKITYMEKVEDRLFCTISDGSGLFAVEMENMMLNLEIAQGQLYSIVCRVKISPDGSMYGEARGLTLLDSADPRLQKLQALPTKKPPEKEAGRACRNYWEKTLPVTRARLKMSYRYVLLIPLLYLLFEPHLFKRLSLGAFGPMLGLILFMLVFLTGRQKIVEYSS
ncbi:MAG: hypothetical protein GX890_04215 [Firmicutes bacterium]|jgi:hypothetical protein|nr:hypothetical protein [Bacillota bacterium]